MLPTCYFGRQTGQNVTRWGNQAGLDVRFLSEIDVLLPSTLRLRWDATTPRCVLYCHKR